MQRSFPILRGGTRRLSACVCEALEHRTLLSSSVGVTVPATSDPWLAAGKTLSDAGTAPIEVSLPAGATVVTFTAVKGTVSYIPGETNGPDGTVKGATIGGVGGISGITTTGGFYALLGLFTASTVGSKPPAVQNYSTIRGAASFSPLVDQMFFVGDGLTGTGSGSVQQFHVPSGATRLYLGFSDNADSGGTPTDYGDNTGSLKATVNITAPALTTATISGTVFDDVNGNGKMDSGELGLGLWTVDLVFTSGSSDGKILTTTTAVNGTFSFAKLAAGSYEVKIIAPYAGVKPTLPAGGILNLTLTAGEISAGHLFGES